MSYSWFCFTLTSDFFTFLEWVGTQQFMNKCCCEDINTCLSCSLFFLPVEYIVEYDYDAVHDDELTIRVGEIIRNVKKLEEEGWLEGELNGKRGMFPDNFVKVSFVQWLLWLHSGLVISEPVPLHTCYISKGTNF